MTQWLAGMRLTEARLEDVTVHTQSTGAVAGSGYSVTTFSGRRAKGVTTVMLLVNRSGASIAEVASNTGNVSPDHTVVTLPTGWRPPQTVNATWGNGSNDGECTISTAGVVTLRTTSGNTGLASGTNFRLTAGWISEDDN